MTFYPVMGSRSAVWHDQGVNKAPKTRRQGILGVSCHMANRETGGTSFEPHPNSHPSLPGDATIGESARIRNKHSTSTCGMEGLIRGPSGRGDSRIGPQGKSGSQEGVAKRESPRNLRLNLYSSVDTRPIKPAVGFGEQSKVVRCERKPTSAPTERPIPAEGSTHVHGLLDQ